MKDKVHGTKREKEVEKRCEGRKVEGRTLRIKFLSESVNPRI